MTDNSYRFMDSDMHVIEPVDLWQRYIDPAYRNIAPIGLDRYQQDVSIEVDGQQIAAGDIDEIIAQKAGPAENYADALTNNWDPASQVRAMEQESMDIALVYPSRGLFVLATDTLDPSFSKAIATAYNNWMHDFCSYSPDRMHGVAMVSPLDVDAAVLEARRAVTELGFKGAFLRPNLYKGRSWHDPYYDPLWAELQDLDVALGFHEGSHVPLPETGADRFGDTYWLFHTCCHSMEMMLATVSMIGGGVLERYPRLRVAFLEANCSWVPWLLWRLDDHYEFSGKIESPALKHEPAEYFKRQCFASVEPAEKPADVIEHYGLTDTIVLSTDYPHPDSKFPHARELFLNLSLSEEAKGKIMWDNCARLYGMT